VSTDQDDGRRPRSPDELWAGIVAEVAAMPDVVANLLRDHQPDAQGYCTGNGCGSAGLGIPTTRWPCSLHTLAAAAQGAALHAVGEDLCAGRPDIPASTEWTAAAARPSEVDGARWGP
jgi:hypothetical protein